MNKLGFGFLRLPRMDENDVNSIDWPLLNEMVDLFLESGGSYFDTAYNYLDGMSEAAIRRSVTERYPREKIWLADKLPSWLVNSYEECPVYFEEQLKRCGVTYFDSYILHGLNKENYEISEKNGAFTFIQKMKEEGRIRKTGFSYHDTAELLDRILTKHPELDVVQLQINYLDWESESVEGRKCYEVAVKHGKEVVVMEPVKGGTLAEVPEKALKILQEIHPEESAASWALRFAQSLDQVSVVLSGMNSMEQMRDNMRDVLPVNEQELEALEQVKKILQENMAIACTGCRYCVSDCPQSIPIPQYFSMYNEYFRDHEDHWKIQPAYEALGEKLGKASDCVRCRSCEQHCPQKIQITQWMEKVAEVFE